MQKNYKENHLKPYAVKSVNSKEEFTKKQKILLDLLTKGIGTE